MVKKVVWMLAGKGAIDKEVVEKVSQVFMNPTMIPSPNESL